jgi:hypothetical protein
MSGPERQRPDGSLEASDHGGTRGCADPRPPTLSEEDDLLLLDLACRIERRHLSAPAVLWLESLRPVSFLGSQAMHFLNPFVQVLVPSAAWPRLARILEEREHLERLIRHVEAVADRPPPGTGEGKRS